MGLWPPPPTCQACTARTQHQSLGISGLIGIRGRAVLAHALNLTPATCSNHSEFIQPRLLPPPPPPPHCLKIASVLSAAAAGAAGSAWRGVTPVPGVAPRVPGGGGGVVLRALMLRDCCLMRLLPSRWPRSHGMKLWSPGGADTAEVPGPRALLPPAVPWVPACPAAAASSWCLSRQRSGLEATDGGAPCAPAQVAPSGLPSAHSSACRLLSVWLGSAGGGPRRPRLCVRGFSCDTAEPPLPCLGSSRPEAPLYILGGGQVWSQPGDLAAPRGPPALRARDTRSPPLPSQPERPFGGGRAEFLSPILALNQYSHSGHGGNINTEWF